MTQGKALLEKELRRLGLMDVNLERLAREFEYKNIEDLYAGIGTGDLPIARIVRYLTQGDKIEGEVETIPLGKPSQVGMDVSAVTVVGLKGLLTNMGRCCNPVPGDAIVGYITRGRGATIHRNDCPNILRIDDRERMVQVSWGEPTKTFPIPIRIKAYDRAGLMQDISTLITDEGINMPKISAETSRNLAIFELTLEVRDILQLSRILDRLENLPNVLEAQRMRPG
jgi:GTP pyrophosphokinase